MSNEASQATAQSGRAPRSLPATHGRRENYIPFNAVPTSVSTGYDPAEVPLYEGREAVEEGYAVAQRERTPFFAVEGYEEGYAVTYDLLPAGRQLAPTAHREVTERLTREVEAIVGDASLPTGEVSRSVSASLGNVSVFDREESARRVAAAISPVVLDESNWVAAEPPENAPAGNRRN